MCIKRVFSIFEFLSSAVKELAMEAAVAEAGVGGGAACASTRPSKWCSSSATPYVPPVSCR